ncbi:MULTISPECIES: T9SS type B sorting domain-containing protein [unclassified Chryseobacterium]|uniref:T9SS type B sorting domain-containing protein n=1 Tax=unclassified Chryseobacterium TaxID=2593645 RepID=UPI00100B3FFB|nr:MULTISPECIES: T9SS type B sorting domain-containing protein [unclassified Chryseobacterium]RXM51046.1 hypothetical protein BOQ64_13190 [Chryseobacterium sp. CH25]RXM64656.1 hypothetical protein BOQ60_10575 [Chryseobacterium sp. CH1]
MKKILSLFMILSAVLLFSQNLLWDFQTKSHIIESQHFIAFSDTDSQGNIYVGGRYGRFAFPSINAITFDNITKTTTVDEDSRVVIAKFDKNKNVIWVKEIRSKYYSSLNSLVVDKQDNLLLTGYTDGNDLKLDPNSETIFNTGINQSSSFMVKLDSNGNFVFGNIYNYVSNMTCTIDLNNNIISTGNYINYPPSFLTDLNPDPNAVFHLPPPNGLFIMKNTSTGAFSWARPLHAHNTPTIHTVKTDHNNDIIVLGNFEAYLKIDNNTFPSSSTNYNQSFLAKFNTNGNFTWYQPLTYFSAYLGTSNSKIEIDNTNNIYTASNNYHTQNITFPNTTINIPMDGRTVIYKINTNGHLVWNSLIKGDVSYDFRSIKLNADNTINFFVRYADNMIKVINGNNNATEIVKRIDIGLNYSYLSNDSQTYYLKFRNDGKLIFNKSDFSSYTFDQSIDYEGNMILVGNYTGYQDFNPDLDIKDIKYTNNNISSFIQKFGKCYNGTPDGDKTQTFCSSINPTINNLYPNTSYTTWYDSLTSTTPLSSTTPLQNNSTYYASVQDESCPFNNKRLAVKVIIKNAPLKLTVNDFYFCSNVNQMTLHQLNINNNQNTRFYDAAGNLISSTSYITGGVQYYVSQYNSDCESEKVPFKVFSIQNTIPTAPQQQTFCATNNPKVSDIQITGQDIKWYDAAGVNLPVTSPLVNGQTYYASQTINSCESSKIAIQVTVNSTPKPAANINQDFCSSANPTLEKLIVAGTSLTFYDAAGNILPVTTTLVHGQTYYVTQKLNNCESEKLAISVTLSSNNVPAKGYAQTLCNDNTGNTMIVNLHTYDGNIINNPNNYIFSYTDAAGNIISNPSAYILNIGSNLINVKVSTAEGCFIMVRLSLTLNPKPVVTLPEKLDFCEGKSAVLDAGTGFKSYLWNTGATTQSITVSLPGTYSVKVINNFGCESTSSTKINYSVLPQIVSVNITNNTATVIISETGNYEYSLDNTTWQDSNIFTNLHLGEYTVYVRTKSGCVIGKKSFSIFNIPNTITPNADGINDIWRIAGLENYPETEVYIYDRKGLLLYKEIIKKKPFQWDGKYDLQPIATGSYWYTIKVSDGRNYSGWLLVKNRE